jgi:hypothetical protein
MAEFEIRDFDGDLHALSAMARDAWREEYAGATWPDLYRPELTRHLFAGVSDPRYLVGAYQGDHLVAFVANLPRTYRLGEVACRGVYGCLLVSHRDAPGAGAYLLLECLRRYRDLGIDLVLLGVEKKHRGWMLFERYVKRRYHIHTLRTMHTLLHGVDLPRIIDSEGLNRLQVAAIRLVGAHRPIVASSVPGTVRPYDPDDLPGVLELANRYATPHSLVRTFDRASLARRLSTPGVTATVVYRRDGAVCGFINCTIHHMVSRRSTHRWVWIDFLYWQGLRASEKQALLAGLWHAARDLDCIGLVEWSRNYYAQGALYRARFVPYPRYLELYALLLNPDLTLDGVDHVVEQAF